MISRAAFVICGACALAATGLVAGCGMQENAMLNEVVPSTPLSRNSESRMDHTVVGRALAPSGQRVGLRTKIGGLPIGLPADAWPKCKECGSPMSFLLQLDLQAPLSQSTRFRFAYVFVCGGFEDDRGCQTWIGNGGANAVVLASEVNDEVCPAPAGVSVRPERTIQWVGWKSEEGHGEARIDKDAAEQLLSAVAESEESEEPIVIDVSGIDRRPDVVFMGGDPVWAQDDDTPICPKCNSPMKLLAEVYSEVEPHKFSPSFQEGYHLPIGHVGYLFGCQDDCPQAEAVFLWQP
jgi:hypothetical protein